jgi:apolipoprotein N-acyltransferase
VQCRDASKQGPHNGLIIFRNALWVSASAYALALTCLSNDFAPLAWVALIPFFVVIRGSSKPASAGYGALWGAVYFTLFGLIKSGLSPYSFPVFVLVGVISSALLAFCLNIVSRRLGFNPLALGLAWLIFEVIRIELVLHSGTLASSQPVDGRLLNMSAFTGLSGLSLLIVVVNVCLILLWECVRTRWSSRSWRESPGVPLTISPPRIAFAHRFDFSRPEERGPPAVWCFQRRSCCAQLQRCNKSRRDRDGCREKDTHGSL